MESFNKKSVAMLAEIRKEMEENPESTESTNTGTKMVLSGRLGPRGDGYFPEKTLIMTEAEAEEYHSQQIGWFAQTEADMVRMTIQFQHFGLLSAILKQLLHPPIHQSRNIHRQSLQVCVPE